MGFPNFGLVLIHCALFFSFLNWINSKKQWMVQYFFLHTFGFTGFFIFLLFFSSPSFSSLSTFSISVSGNSLMRILLDSPGNWTTSQFCLHCTVSISHLAISFTISSFHKMHLRIWFTVDSNLIFFSLSNWSFSNSFWSWFSLTGIVLHRTVCCHSRCLTHTKNCTLCQLNAICFWTRNPNESNKG